MAANPQPATVTAHEHAEACPNCDTNFLGTFCHHCGEKQLHRHDLALRHFASHAVHEITHLDARFFATIRYLFTRPGHLTAEYFAGRRSRYMKPLSLFLVAVALMFLADSIRPLSLYNLQWIAKRDKDHKLDDAWEKLAAKTHQPKELVVERVQERIHRVITAVQFANVFGMAIILWLLYRKRYFVEHLVMSLHFLAFLYLCTALLSLTDPFLRVPGTRGVVYFVFKIALFTAYLFVALRRVYPQNAGLTLVKAVVAYACVQLVLILTPIVTLIAAVIAAVKA